MLDLFFILCFPRYFRSNNYVFNFPVIYGGSEEKWWEIKTCFPQDRVLPNVEFIEDLRRSSLHLLPASELPYGNQKLSPHKKS